MDFVFLLRILVNGEMRIALIGQCSLLLLGCLGSGIWLGSNILDEQTRQQKAHLAELNRQLPNLLQQTRLLKQKLSNCEQTIQLDRLVLDNSQQELVDLQQELSEALRKLGFYRRIISEDSKGQEIRVEDFQVYPGMNPAFRIILVQSKVKSREREGHILIFFQGHEQGEARKLSLQEVDVQGRSALDFRFRHYLMLSGELRWPEGFVPEFVELKLILGDEKQRIISRTWAWDEVLASRPAP